MIVNTIVDRFVKKSKEQANISCVFRFFGKNLNFFEYCIAKRQKVCYTVGSMDSGLEQVG